MQKEKFSKVFFGEGKGKTSAALGTAFKELGSGTNAIIVLFNKDESETKLLKKFEPEIKVFEFEEDMALNYSRKALSSKECDILVLDEILKLIDSNPEREKDILDLLEIQKKNHMTLILTGEHITPGIEEKADYVIEMKKIK